MRHVRVAVVAMVIVFPLLLVALAWGTWAFDGCRYADGTRSHGGGCDDIDGWVLLVLESLVAFVGAAIASALALIGSSVRRRVLRTH